MWSLTSCSVRAQMQSLPVFFSLQNGAQRSASAKRSTKAEDAAVVPLRPIFSRSLVGLGAGQPFVVGEKGDRVAGLAQARVGAPHPANGVRGEEGEVGLRRLPALELFPVEVPQELVHLLALDLGLPELEVAVIHHQEVLVAGPAGLFGAEGQPLDQGVEPPLALTLVHAVEEAGVDREKLAGRRPVRAGRPERDAVRPADEGQEAGQDNLRPCGFLFPRRFGPLGLLLPFPQVPEVAVPGSAEIGAVIEQRPGDLRSVASDIRGQPGALEAGPVEQKRQALESSVRSRIFLHSEAVNFLEATFGVLGKLYPRR